MSELSEQALADLLEHWLAVDSTSGEEREFLELLEAFFSDDGWKVERQRVADGRWNLVIRDGEELDLIFSTHVDTVPPFLPVRRTEDEIFGRGACDTKGGLVAMWAAARRLRDRGVKGLGFLLVVGEEVDHCGAKVAARLDLEPARIILCEPTRNRVVSAQKGMLKFTLTTSGVAGHSAFPDDGVSAVDPLLDALQRLREEPWPEDELLGPTTINIGVITAGVAANVFAPSAQAQVLMRAVSDTEELLARVEEVIGDSVELDKPIYNDPVFFDPPPGVATCTVPFNTDATYLRPLGEIWLVGPGDIRCAHSDDERIALKSLMDGVDLYVDLAEIALARS